MISLTTYDEQSDQQNWLKKVRKPNWEISSFPLNGSEQIEQVEPMGQFFQDKII